MNDLEVISTPLPFDSYDVLPSAVLDALSAHIAVLDQDGDIIFVNDAWRNFAESNPPAIIEACLNSNYLAVCESAVGASSDGAAKFAEGLRGVMNGTLSEFYMEYPCHSPKIKRWFLGRVTPLPGDVQGRVVVAHENITVRKILQRNLEAEPAASSLTLNAAAVNSGESIKSGSNVVHKLRKFSLLASALSVGISGAVLLGWALDIAALKSVLPHFVAMNPTTALCFIALGVCIWLERITGARAKHTAAGIAIAVAVAVLTGIKLISVFTSIDFEIDQFLFRGRLESLNGLPPNRMAPNTAVTMLFLSVALLCFPFRRLRPAARGFAFAAFLIAIFATIGYLYGAESFYKISLFIPMAANTAGVFMLLATAILFAHPAEGYGGVITRNDLGGKIARLLIPIAFLVPLVLGWVRVTGQKAELHSSDLGTAFNTIAYMIIFTSVILWAARKMSNADTLREENQRALRLSEQRFRNAIDHAPIGMALVSTDGAFMQVNQKLCRILGLSEHELLSSTFQSITHPDDLGTDLQYLADVISGGIDSYSMEKRYFHKDSRIIWASLGVSVVRNDDGEPLYFISQIQDITDKKATDDELLRNARQDALTGLPNRTTFNIAVQHAIDRKIRCPTNAFAVLFIDLDRFKIINDSMGHIVGDQLLKAVAAKLNACVRPTDMVSRLGGDEFTILLEHSHDLNHAANAIRVAQRIHREIEKPFKVGTKEVYTGASIGIALSLTSYESPEDLIRDADNAMYRAKAAGKGRYEIFDPAMHVAAVERIELEADMRTAVKAQQFFLAFQPIVFLSNGKASGFEALVRWNHPKKGTVMPGHFIPIAEETALILPIGLWVLRAACLWIMNVNQKRPAQQLLTINVNVSPRQLQHPAFVDEVRSVLQETNLPPDILRLEITEGTIVELSETVQDVLSRLRALGVQLQVDDFGTGYSSLAYLHRMPVDALKIDRSFVAEMSASKEAVEIIRTIMALAQSLGVGVVAEGVETAEQADALKEMGCELAQGYFFAKPMTPEAAQELLAN